ncbi:MAG: VTT domain-containing protein [Candidatus Freyarchaeota archaeon]|nr:VTT domain-containing protein [Candidatus Freyrarchaeum guaymaensis]
MVRLAEKDKTGATTQVFFTLSILPAGIVTWYIYYFVNPYIAYWLDPSYMIWDLFRLWMNPLAWGMFWFSNWFPGGDLGVYIAVFLVSIFGNISIIFPVPYVIFLWFLVVFRVTINPFILGVSAGAGAAIGETSAWILGRGASEVLEDTRYGDRLRRYGELVERGWGIPLVILFAATPLPDDVLLLALGMVEYSYVKTIVSCFIGKILMCVMITFAARTLSNIRIFGKTILGWYSGEAGLATMIASIILMVLVFIALVFVDWRKIYNKLRRR